MSRIPTAAACLAATFLSATLWTTPSQAQFEDEGRMAFITADISGDEVLDSAEFRVFIDTMADYGARMAKRIAFFGAYQLAFNRVDADGNGLATPDELLAAEARGEG